MLECRPSSLGPLLLSLLAIGTLGAHCPCPPTAVGVTDFGSTQDKTGMSGYAIVNGVLRTTGPVPADRFWPAVGMPADPNPPVTCVLPESVGGLPGRPEEGEGLPPGGYRPGEGRLPEDYPDPEKYPGSTGGGCGTFATLQCNDILDGQNTPITPDGWNKAHSGIGESAAGGSTPQGRADYYVKKGYCVDTIIMGPGGIAKIKQKKAKGCDCAIYMHGPTSGHVEVITGTTIKDGKECLTTNSWGRIATVCGADKNNGDDFSHSEDRPGGNFAGGSPHWPPGQTRVYWQCACKPGDCEQIY